MKKQPKKGIIYDTTDLCRKITKRTCYRKFLLIQQKFQDIMILRSYTFLRNDLPSSYLWKGGLDLLNIVMIDIANELPKHDDKYELHYLLNTLLSVRLTVDEKLRIMKSEYNIPVDDELRKDVSAMLSLVPPVQYVNAA